MSFLLNHFIVLARYYYPIILVMLCLTKRQDKWSRFCSRTIANIDVGKSSRWWLARWAPCSAYPKRTSYFATVITVETRIDLLPHPSPDDSRCDPSRRAVSQSRSGCPAGRKLPLGRNGFLWLGGIPECKNQKTGLCLGSKRSICLVSDVPVSTWPRPWTDFPPALPASPEIAALRKKHSFKRPILQ